MIKLTMNLTQIQEQFRLHDLKAGWCQYKYDPTKPKVPGLKQHHYIDELAQAVKIDNEIFGFNKYDQQQET